MHVEKYNRFQTQILLKHYSREHFYYENKNINRKKTKLNYNLCERKNAKNFLEKRLSEVKVQNRRDVNIMCDWIITLPKNPFSEEQERAFFKEAYNFFIKKYGEENTISAWVHKDETQAHMHFCFIPIVFEKKKERYKVCAKELITKKELQKIHSEMQNYLNIKLNFEAKILNDNKTQSYKKVEELKLETELKSIKELNKSLKAKELATTATLIKQNYNLVNFFSRALEVVKSNKSLIKNKEKEHIR